MPDERFDLDDPFHGAPPGQYTQDSLLVEEMQRWDPMTWFPVHEQDFSELYAKADLYPGLDDPPRTNLPRVEEPLSWPGPDDTGEIPLEEFEEDEPFDTDEDSSYPPAVEPEGEEERAEVRAARPARPWVASADVEGEEPFTWGRPAPELEPEEDVQPAQYAGSKWGIAPSQTFSIKDCACSNSEASCGCGG